MSMNPPLRTPALRATRWRSPAATCAGWAAVPNLLLLSLTTGALFVLPFRYVFGGAIRTLGINHVRLPGAPVVVVLADVVLLLAVLA